jgi:hypothetical protein
MRALLYHSRHHLEAEDDEALLGLVRDHLIREHPAIVPTDEWVIQVVATRSYYLEYAPVHVGGAHSRRSSALTLIEPSARERPTGGRAS